MPDSAISGAVVGADAAALLVILAMAAVTWITRLGGFWLYMRVPGAHRWEKWLSHVPGAILVAIVAPAAVVHGPASTVAVLATGAVVKTTGKSLPAMAAGVIAFALARAAFG